MINYRNGLFTVRDLAFNVLDDFYRVSIFPAGEMNIEVKYTLARNVITEVPFKSFDTRWLEELILLCNGLKDLLINVSQITILYMPYSRADRVIEKNGFYQLNNNKTILNILSSLCDKVVTLDLHSLKNRTGNLVNIIPNYSILEKFNIVFPDMGSTIRPLFEYVLKNNIPYITCDKTRTDDGIMIKISKNNSDESKDFLVIDDICDGGKTFIELANELKKLKIFKNKKLNLCVTHGIFSSGKEILKEHFDNVYAIHEFEKCKNLKV